MLVVRKKQSERGDAQLLRRRVAAAGDVGAAGHGERSKDVSVDAVEADALKTSTGSSAIRAGGRLASSITLRVIRLAS